MCLGVLSFGADTEEKGLTLASRKLAVVCRE